MTRILLIVAGLLLLRFIINLSRFLRAKRYLARYHKWLENPDDKLLESRAQVRKLLKDVNVSDGYIGVTQHTGLNRIQTANVSVIDAFPNTRRDFVQGTNYLFREAIGTYRQRMIDTFNPLYWIETVLHLPKVVLTYLGLPPESVFIKGVLII